MRSIAWRRAQRERIRAKRLRDMPWLVRNRAGVQACIGIYIDTPHRCSCPGCGNQRKYEGVTLDEKRIEAEEKLALANL